jgi:hypothetical protein
MLNMHIPRSSTTTTQFSLTPISIQRFGGVGLVILRGVSDYDGRELASFLFRNMGMVVEASHERT